jgi:hypothetical protein
MKDTFIEITVVILILCVFARAFYILSGWQDIISGFKQAGVFNSIIGVSLAILILKGINSLWK